jgi:PPOX class probable F420-dependent enzyme
MTLATYRGGLTMLDLKGPEHTHALERLRDNPMIWLSSVRPDGRPHIVPVWFVMDDDSILIFSIPDNQKVRNLRQNPNVMLALDDTHGGDDVVMIEGRAELLSDPSVSATATPAFATKYAKQIAQLFSDPRGMATQYSQAIRITPTRILEY